MGRARVGPDAVVLAKHLGGGLMPISAMLTRKEIFLEAYGRDFASGESHNCTFSTNALAILALGVYPGALLALCVNAFG